MLAVAENLVSEAVRRAPGPGANRDPLPARNTWEAQSQDDADRVVGAEGSTSTHHRHSAAGIGSTIEIGWPGSGVELCIILRSIRMRQQLARPTWPKMVITVNWVPGSGPCVKRQA